MKNKKDKIKDKFSFKMLFNRFTKVIVIITIVYSMALTTISYIWSYLGKDPLVNLSSTIISTLVAPVITYLITNCIQCLFEYNQLAFSTPLAAIESGIVQSPTTSTSTYDEYTESIESSVGTVDNPIDLDELPLFEFGDTACGKGDD